MRLVSLEINGFKSFAQKTKIEFMRGMTGIVGPNGSGKSNIIEAIRWVMGEQSAKDLRGNKMADVIFGGSSSRKPLNRAEVSITFDNSDHYIDSSFNEIKITRRLYRNGDSQYLVNNTECRLKDVLDLFMDTGLGRESFSIISQGRVEEIFNGKPEDRRAVIEEVAGVAKYKKNKDIAEKRLSDTNDNLHRVNDIINELEDQMEPLAEQSALAKDYLDQKKRFDLLDRSKTVFQIQKNQTDQVAISERLKNAQELTEQYDAQTDAATEVTNELKNSQSNLNARKDELQQTLLEQTKRIAELENTSNLNDERQKNQQANIEQIKQQQLAAKQHLAQLKEESAQLTDEQEQQKSAIKTQQDDLDQLEQLTGQERQSLLQQKIEELQNQQVDLMQELTTVHNQKTYMKRDFEQDSKRQNAAQTQLATAQKNVDDFKAEQELLTESLAQVQQTESEVEARFNEEQARKQELNEQYQQARQKWYDVLRQVQTAQSKIDSFKSLDADYAGFYQGVRFVLQSKTKFDGLLGPVAELVNVPAKYTQAIETVLGGQLQNIVVRDQAVGKNIIQYLVANRAGRVTILPLDNLQQRSNDQTLVKHLAAMPGFEGVASELIDTNVPIVANYLLGRTIIADNLDHATKIAQSGQHRFRVVTLDGQLINASGSMTGGANKRQQQGLLTRQKEETELSQQLETLQLQNKQLEDQVSKYDEAIKSNQVVLEKIGDELATAKQAVQTKNGEQTVLQEKMTIANRQLTALSYEVNSQENAQSNFDEQVAQNKKREDQLNQEIEQAKQSINDQKKALADLINNENAQEEQIQSKKQWLAVAREKLQHVEQSIKTTQAAIDEDTQNLETLNSSINVKMVSNENSETARKEATQKLKVLRIDQKDSQDELKTISNDLNNTEEEIQIAEQKMTRLQELQRAALNELNDVNAKRVKIEANIDNGLNRLAEQYKMSLTEAQENLSDLEEAQIDSQLKLLKRGLDEIGTVNIGSIEEYERVSKRYTFLHDQQTDLLNSKQQLNDTMEEMDQEVMTRFEQSYHEVAAAFEKIFVQMFGGGQAKLVLTNPDNLLTSGIDIIAQPPGKKNQQLSLLSGGERALTAIALLFSILAVRPVPFAVLDETEAALDEANVNRYARYLSTYGDDGPQFIVVTHRKGTMMSAKVLYGVTMQESGVSKMVSVSLEDVPES